MVEGGSLEIEGFEFNRQDRNSNGGGVITYIDERLESITLNEIPNKYAKLELEVTVSCIHPKKPNDSLIIIGLYRPPNSKAKWFEAFNNLLLETTALGKVVLLGDVNIDTLLTESLLYRKLMQSLKIINANLGPLQPTRITEHTATSIDIIAVPKEIKMTSCEVLNFTTSDHLPVQALIDFSSLSKTEPIVKRSYRKMNTELLECRIAEISLSRDPEVSVDSLAQQWQDHMIQTLDELASY